MGRSTREVETAATTSVELVEAGGAGAALAVLEEALDGLITSCGSGGLAEPDRDGLLKFIKSFERVRSRLAVVDHQIVAECDERSLGHELLKRNTPTLLAELLRISPGEARRRVKAAESLQERLTMLGERLDPIRPWLAAAERSGEVGRENSAIVVECLDHLSRLGPVTAEQVAEAEQTMVDLAVKFGPHDLRKLAMKLTDVLFPDGTVMADHDLADARQLHLTKKRSGGYRICGDLTNALGAKLFAALSPLAAPRPEDADGKDPRTVGQRWHDAMEDLVSRLLRVGGLPVSGGTAATVIVTIDWDDLLKRTGFGETGDGSVMSVSEVLNMANEAEILPAVLSKSGVVLDMGRSRRIANQHQTLAMIARDGGCSFPGCTQPAEWCQRHHTVEWIQGGKTDIGNMTLVCGYHHRNFESRGWRVRIRAGLPEWIPPKWIDFEQQPIIHTRIKQQLLTRAA